MKRLLLLLSVAVACMACGSSDRYDDSNFTTIFNGKDFSGWYLKIRSGDEDLAKRVYAIEDGMVHVFNDDFPNPYNLGARDTHGLFYTEKSYSKFILRFDYKWGETIANNFNQFQYDAGCYYHVIDDKIWPDGIEYQVRYNSVTGENHTGDFWISPKTKFNWYNDGKGHFLPESEGGKLLPKHRSGEHRALKAAPYHALDGEWNECEIIVMGDEYAIHKLNGEIVNMATDLGYDSGKIGLQSETAEIYYRNVRIMEFDEVVPMSEFVK